MIENGLVERHDKCLQVTPLTMGMAASLSWLAVNRTICHQIFVRIAQEVGETINFVRPEKLGMIYVDRVETNWPFCIMLPVCTHGPFHCTANGKTFLASLAKLRRKKMIESLNLEAHTSQTQTTVEALEAELHTIRRNGFALNREEFYTGIVAIAVPVTDGAGRYFAALGCHGPVQRFSLVDAEACKSLMLNASAEISVSLLGISPECVIRLSSCKIDFMHGFFCDML